MTRKKQVRSGIRDRVTRSWSVERVIVVGIALLTTVVIIGVILLSSNRSQPPRTDYSVPDESKTFADLGRDHIAPESTHAPYNSNPPTSGPHYVTPANWGVYRQTIADEIVLHNLEHGGIWISYRDQTDEKTIAQLEAITGQYPGNIIVTYRPSNDRPIAVAAWGRLLLLDTVDSAQIYNFANRYRLHGPENIPGP